MDISCHKVFAFAHDLGTVEAAQTTPVVYAIGLVRDPAVQYTLAGGVTQARSLYFWSRWSTVIEAVRDMPFSALRTANAVLLLKFPAWRKTCRFKSSWATISTQWRERPRSIPKFKRTRTRSRATMRMWWRCRSARRLAPLRSRCPSNPVDHGTRAM